MLYLTVHILVLKNHPTEIHTILWPNISKLCWHTTSLTGTSYFEQHTTSTLGVAITVTSKGPVTEWNLVCLPWHHEISWFSHISGNWYLSNQAHIQSVNGTHLIYLLKSDMKSRNHTRTDFKSCTQYLGGWQTPWLQVVVITWIWLLLW